MESPSTILSGASRQSALLYSATKMRRSRHHRLRATDALISALAQRQRLFKPLTTADSDQLTFSHVTERRPVNISKSRAANLSKAKGASQPQCAQLLERQAEG